MNKFLILCVCLSMAGCTTYEGYSSTYQAALKSKSTTVVMKQGDYQELKQKVAGYFNDRGYEKVVYSDDKNGFYVFSKEGMFQEPCEIIVKYTVQPSDNQTRIDMVKGSDSMVTENQVAEDISQIVDQIKNN